MGCVQEAVATLNPGSGPQAQTKALGGWQEGDHPPPEKRRGGKKGGSCESGSEEACEEEDGKGLRTGRGCRSVGVGGRAGCQRATLLLLKIDRDALLVAVVSYKRRGVPGVFHRVLAVPP